MSITRRQRRRILAVLLPLLAFVWATLPALPCCHEVAAGDEAGVQATMAEMSAHAGHHGGAAFDDGFADADLLGFSGADPVGFAVEHGPNHCEQAPVPMPPVDPPCTDIEKTSNDLRPVYAAAPLAVFMGVLPVLRVAVETRAPLPDLPPPPRSRPLHLEKSVLLI